MITDKFIKGYAVLKSSWFSNILDEYLCFVATIIIEENMEEIDENLICEKLSKKYNIKFQLTFVRQILSYAVSKKVIEKKREKFIVNNDKIKKYKIDLESFDHDFNLLIDKFLLFANEHRYFPEKESATRLVYDFIDKYDDRILYNDFDDIDVGDPTFLYCWCSFVLYLQEEIPNLYEFFVGLCSANLIKNALFYSGEFHHMESQLQVYLDTPMIFAILGMDTPERAEAYKYLLQKASSIGMSIKVFDHNFEEAKGIMERASRWALSNKYQADKANRVAQFFYDSQMTEIEIEEYIHDFEASLNSLGITKDASSYLTEENAFQIDEEKLFETIKEEYGKRALKYTSEEEYDNSIKTDVRSLVMIQRKRAGTYSTDLKSSKCVFVTTNGIIAKISKDYTLEDELTRDKIPTSITADIFGTLLWLDFPEKNNYQSYKMLADCKSLLKPTPMMIAQFNKELENAYTRRETGLTEDKFLFLRSHPIVKSVLLDATSGDYTQYTGNIWQDVYNRIVSKAQYDGEQKYEIERTEHEKTKSDLLIISDSLEEEKKKGDKLRDDLDNQAETFSSILSQIIAVAIFALPYIALTLTTIFIQNAFFEWSVKGIIIGSLTLLVTILIPIAYKKLRNALKIAIKKKFKK